MSDTSKTKLYQRVLDQFEIYAGNDDCLDLQPVDDITDEIERLERERDEWADKWHKVRAELAELKFPGMKGVVHAQETTGGRK